MKRRRALILSLTVVLALCAACSGWLYKERQQYRRNRQLIQALVQGDIQAALALVNAGADPNTRYDPPPAPSLKLLLDHLLHRPLPRNDSPTALMFTCGIVWDPTIGKPIPSPTAPENLPLLQAMLAHGADLNARTQYGFTALLEAVTMNRYQTVSLLLQHGANINVRGDGGRTPLMYALANGSVNTAHLLLLRGANPNAQDDYGQAALHYVISPDTRKFIRELLAHGADPNLRDKQGLTPLQLAQRQHRPDLVRLLTHGAK